MFRSKAEKLIKNFSPTRKHERKQKIGRFSNPRNNSTQTTRNRTKSNPTIHLCIYNFTI